MVEQQTARYLLNRALTDDAYGLSAAHLWFWEGARWHELLFCIAARTSGVEETALRALISELNDLELIQVESLAALPRSDGGIVDNEAPAFKFLADTMARYAVSPDHVRRTVTAFADAAITIDKAFDGRVQKYLRHYGERMLKELGQHFSFADLSEEEIVDAFTEWLQNCLTMPLSLRDADMRAFCEGRGTTVEALIEAADAANVNVAYLDDLVQAQASLYTVPLQTEKHPVQPEAGR